MERTGKIPAILGPYNLIDIGTGVLTAFATALASTTSCAAARASTSTARCAQTATYHQTPYMLDYAGHVSDEPRGYEALGTGPLQRFYQASGRLVLPRRDAG